MASMTETLIKDLRYAVRSFRSNLAFALAATLTLGLGIGATTAIFSVVNAVLLRPLPYSDPGRLALIWNDMQARNVRDYPVSGPTYVDMRTQTNSFADVAGVNAFRTDLVTVDNQADGISALGATSNILQVLGVRVALGRDFISDDAFAPATPPAGANSTASTATANSTNPLPQMVLLSERYWRRRFGGDPKVVGMAVTIGGAPAKIIGVLRPEFEILFPSRVSVDPHPDVVIASRIDYATSPRLNPLVRLVARMKPGVTLTAANRDVERIASTTRDASPILKTAGIHFRVEAMASDLVGEVRPALLAFMGAVVAVLLIACANVASLLLVRMAARERELAVRAALGGSSGRIAGQLFMENLLLAGAGGVAALGFAFVAIKVLTTIAPPNLPRLDAISIDGRVLSFAVLVTLGTSLIVGLAPALRSARPDLAGVLRSSGRGTQLAIGRRLRGFVVTAQVALTLVLLVGCGLMIRSVVRLVRTDPGFEPRGLLTFSVIPRGGTSPDQRAAFVSQLRTQLQAIPGVRSVTAATPLPLDGGIAMGRWGTEAAVSDPSKFQQGDVHIVLPGYFSAMRTRLIAGRDFNDEDNRREVANVVIDSLLAQAAFPGQNAVGRRLYARIRGPEDWLTVIGVVAHEHHESLALDGRGAMFFPDQFLAPGSVRRWAVRASCNRNDVCNPSSLATSVRTAVASVDSHIGVSELQPMSALVDRATAQTRFSLFVIGVFAGIAATLACVGLYGVIASAVRQRTSEFGIRMTYGATPQRILAQVIGEGLKLVSVGVVAGLIAAIGLTRGMRSMLVGVAPTDLPTYVVVVLVFVIVAIAACLIPARRAAALDPAIALRN